MILLLSLLSFATFILGAVVFVLCDRQRKLLAALELITETQGRCATVIAVQAATLADHGGAITALTKGAEIVGEYMGETNRRLCDLERSSMQRDARTGEVQH